MSASTFGTAVSDPDLTARLTTLARLLGEGARWSGPAEALADLAASQGWSAAGFRWPARGPAKLALEATATGRAVEAPEPPDRPLPAVVGNRSFVPAAPADRPAGVFWAVRDAGTWAPADGAFVALAGQAFARSDVARAALGPAEDRASVARRLCDASVVAGRVAHDLDNVFTGMHGFAELALSLLPRGSQPHQFISEANVAAERGMKFCLQLHQLSRAGSARPMPSSVRLALDREQDRLKSAAARLVLDAPADLPAVGLDATALGNVFGNLIDNAVEASPAGAAVRVSARLVDLAAADVPSYHGDPAAGPNVEVAIADAGPGLAEASLRRMFVEPFFTTKVKHRGLGLIVVHRTLHAHRGGVRAESEPGVGTTVRVVLPPAGTRRPAATTTEPDLIRSAGRKA